MSTSALWAKKLHKDQNGLIWSENKWVSELGVENETWGQYNWRETTEAREEESLVEEMKSWEGGWKEEEGEGMHHVCQVFSKWKGEKRRRIQEDRFYRIKMPGIYEGRERRVN